MKLEEKKSFSYPSTDVQKSIETKLNSGNNLIDYFIVIGTKPEIFRNEKLYSLSLQEITSQFEEELSPVILSKYPPIEKKISGIDDTLIQHCFPNGYQIEEHSKCPNFKIFSILLDNNNFSLDYPYKYVTCFQFYESLQNYKKLNEKYLQYEQNINNNINNNGVKNSLLSSISIVSSNFDNVSIYNSTSLYESTIQSTDSSQNIPLTSKRRTFNMSSVNKVYTYKNYYIPKCICIISLYPFLDEYSTILQLIYKYSTMIKQPIPLEKIIENITMDLPTPPHGIYQIEYNFLNLPITFNTNYMNEIPILSFQYEKLFLLFNIKEIIFIFKYILLGARIIFFSSDICLLTPLILTCLSFLFPFQYPFNVISILPKGTYHLIDGFASVIFGVNDGYYKNFYSDNDIDVNDVILSIDVDNKKLEPKYAKGVNQLPELPKEYEKELYNKLNKYINKITNNSNPNLAKENPRNFQYKIRKKFLNFHCNVMKNYDKYIDQNVYTHQVTKNALESAFKVKEFLNNLKHKDDKPFYKRFIETQMFCEFIYKRLTPKNLKEKLDILFFEQFMYKKFHKDIIKNNNNSPLSDNDSQSNDNSISSNSSDSKKNTNNLNNNFDLSFIDSKDYLFTKKYNVPKFKQLSNSELEYLSSKQKELFDDGIFFYKETFTYYVFPRLQSEYFYYNNAKNYTDNIKEDIYGEISIINSNLSSKSHMNSLEISVNEMENYIYLCWIKLWIYSYWYHEVEERNYRFNELLKVLDLVSHHHMELFNTLFQILLLNNSDDNMFFKLYERIIHYNLSPSIYIFDMVKNLIIKRIAKNNEPISQIVQNNNNSSNCPSSNNQNINNKSTKSNSKNIIFHHQFTKNKSLPSNINILKYIKNYKFASEETVKIFRKRSIKSKIEKSILNENIIKFYIQNQCKNCKRNLCLRDIMKNLNNSTKDTLWAKCPNCKVAFFPEMKVKFGFEINKKDDHIVNTSIEDEIALYSPFSLYYTHINNIIIKNKIDIDKLKETFTAQFWNFIFYFKYKGLPYNFMLPYEANTLGFTNLLTVFQKNHDFDISYSQSIKKNIDISRYKYRRLNSIKDKNKKFLRNSLVDINNNFSQNLDNNNTETNKNIDNEEALLLRNTNYTSEFTVTINKDKDNNNEPMNNSNNTESIINNSKYANNNNILKIFPSNDINNNINLRNTVNSFNSSINCSKHKFAIEDLMISKEIILSIHNNTEIDNNDMINQINYLDQIKNEETILNPRDLLDNTLPYDVLSRNTENEYSVTDYQYKINNYEPKKKLNNIHNINSNNNLNTTMNIINNNLNYFSNNNIDYSRRFSTNLSLEIYNSNNLLDDMSINSDEDKGKVRINQHAHKKNLRKFTDPNNDLSDPSNKIYNKKATKKNNTNINKDENSEESDLENEDEYELEINSEDENKIRNSSNVNSIENNCESHIESNVRKTDGPITLGRKPLLQFSNDNKIKERKLPFTSDKALLNKIGKLHINCEYSNLNNQDINNYNTYENKISNPFQLSSDANINPFKRLNSKNLSNKNLLNLQNDNIDDDEFLIHSERNSRNNIHSNSIKESYSNLNLNLNIQNVISNNLNSHRNPTIRNSNNLIISSGKKKVFTKFDVENNIREGQETPKKELISVNVNNIRSIIDNNNNIKTSKKIIFNNDNTTQIYKKDE